MKIANVNGRAVLVLGDEIADIATASDGRFGPDPMSLYDDWAAFVEFAGSVTAGTGPLVEAELRLPRARALGRCSPSGSTTAATPRSRAWTLPTVPATFTKFPAVARRPVRRHRDRRRQRSTGRSSSSPSSARRADRVAEADAWAHVAGLTVGQDISDRHLQFAAGAQFSLGKSRRGYGPMGPWVVTLDELADPDDLALGCSVDGETVQDARTSDLIFGVPRLVAELSAVLPLLPGDVIFTGTPAGRRRHPPAAPVPAARRGPRDLDRGHRHHPQPLRLMGAYANAFGPHAADATYVAHAFDEQLFDTGEVQLNHVVAGDAGLARAAADPRPDRVVVGLRGGDPAPRRALPRVRRRPARAGPVDRGPPAATRSTTWATTSCASSTA